MPNDEFRMMKECRMKNDKMPIARLLFVIRVSSLTRHSAFDIRHSDHE